MPILHMIMHQEDHRHLLINIKKQLCCLKTEPNFQAQHFVLNIE